jgi:hypothetical protein
MTQFALCLHEYVAYHFAGLEALYYRDGEPITREEFQLAYSVKTGR